MIVLWSWCSIGQIISQEDQIFLSTLKHTCCLGKQVRGFLETHMQQFLMIRESAIPFPPRRKDETPLVFKNAQPTQSSQPRSQSQRQISPRAYGGVSYLIFISCGLLVVTLFLNRARAFLKSLFLYVRASA